VPLQVSHIWLQRSRQLLGDTLKAHSQVSLDDACRVLATSMKTPSWPVPYSTPARPDFLTLCMHDHPAEFTWGNTAASAVAVLPEAGEPFMWWAAAHPMHQRLSPGLGDGTRSAGSPLRPKKSTKCFPTPMPKTGRSRRSTGQTERSRPHASSSKTLVQCIGGIY
jgi:hypothetical protein